LCRGAYEHLLPTATPASIPPGSRRRLPHKEMARQGEVGSKPAHPVALSVLPFLWKPPGAARQIQQEDGPPCLVLPDRAFLLSEDWARAPLKKKKKKKAGPPSTGGLEHWAGPRPSAPTSHALPARCGRWSCFVFPPILTSMEKDGNHQADRREFCTKGAAPGMAVSVAGLKPKAHAADDTARGFSRGPPKLRSSFLKPAHLFAALTPPARGEVKGKKNTGPDRPPVATVQGTQGARAMKTTFRHRCLAARSPARTTAKALADVRRPPEGHNTGRRPPQELRCKREEVPDKKSSGPMPQEGGRINARTASDAVPRKKNGPGVVSPAVQTGFSRFPSPCGK